MCGYQFSIKNILDWKTIYPLILATANINVNLLTQTGKECIKFSKVDKGMPELKKK